MVMKCKVIVCYGIVLVVVVVVQLTLLIGPCSLTSRNYVAMFETLLTGACLRT